MATQSKDLKGPPELTQLKPLPRATILVCFAVKEEARPFARLVAADRRISILLTGIGAQNARSSLRNFLSKGRPSIVISAGFAGGLRPELTCGTVLFAADAETGVQASLLSAGARRGSFHCVDRIATTAEQKRALWQSAKADAVEMESAIISEVCRSEAIPSATIRVILDTAEEDLPLDFNRFMTSDHRMNYARFAATLLRTPGKVPALIRLQKRSSAAAEKLAQVLIKLLM